MNMANFKAEIFKAYDIRGIYEEDFGVGFAQELGNKIASGRKVVIGRDNRASSPVLEQAVIAGAIESGAEVISIGECSTPLFYFAVNQVGAEGGIMVTASHNQPEYNGFKVVGERAELADGPTLKTQFESREVSVKSGGVVTTLDPLLDYIDRVEEVSQVNFPIPPLDDIKIVFDNDHDRISFEENKQAIAPEFIFLLLVEKCGFKKVVYDLRFSRVVAEKLAKWGVEGVKSKVGRTNVYELMRKTEADFGGELSGHYYFKSFNNLEAPELVLADVAKAMNTSGQTLQALTASYKKYFKSEEVSIELVDQDVLPEIFQKLKEKYSDGEIEELDGLTINYPDWWFNVRASNTEPELRLVVEAETQELLNSKLAEVQEILRAAS
ncbi:MAG: Phosphomannomutase [Microgenomates group bacterium GW2011_GWA1_Microgenomates_45_10]|nr:MAG: Phosphomannomutase [Microgenomates group bacterium GW2011_GWA1_Microgenomates_45_10]